MTNQDHVSAGTIAMLGVPWDANSSFLRGPAMAPIRIREALHSYASNLSTERGNDLGQNALFQDVGDVEFDDVQSPSDEITRSVAALIEQGAHVLALGGDHAITYPLVAAHARTYPNLTILHLDAHPDLYDNFENNPDSHASPFARIMENGLATRLVQIGIRTINSHQRQQADRFGVEVYDMLGWTGTSATNLASDVISTLEGPIYLSLDMDVLDPAFAPGISHHEPGGLSTREVLTLIQAISDPLVGADVVELNPSRDPLGITAMAAAKFVKEIADIMCRNQ